MLHECDLAVVAQEHVEAKIWDFHILVSFSAKLLPGCIYIGRCG